MFNEAIHKVEKGIYFLRVKNENNLKVSFETLIFIM
jgi:hypothetical protein